MSESIAIIPARGGSTRLPRKNIMPLCGRPLIAWTIEPALKSGLFDKVLVSTDDEEIAEVARDCGAEVPFLREDYADHYSASSLATLAALDQAEQFWEKKFTTVAQLLPTCPLRGVEEIKSAIEIFAASGAPAQISVFEFGWMNPWWAARRLPNGQPDWLFPDSRIQRSQDLEPLYCPSGAIWIARNEALREAQSFYTPDHTIVSISWQAAIDIDNEQDLQMAEVLLRARDTF